MRHSLFEPTSRSQASRRKTSRKLQVEQLELRSLCAIDTNLNVNGLISGINWANTTNLGSSTSSYTSSTTSTTSTSTNSAPVAVSEALNTYKNVPINFTSAAILSNDTDADSDALYIHRYLSPSHGTLVKHPNGAMTYHPPTGYVGTDSIEYIATDGQIASNVATITINISEPTPASGGTAGEFVVAFDPASGHWSGSNLASGDSQVLAVWTPGSGSTGAGWRDGVSGDFNADGITDVAARTAAGQWWVGLSDATNPGSYSTQYWGAWDDYDPSNSALSLTWDKLQVVDLNGDGRDDIAAFNIATATWRMAISTGDEFNSQRFRWSTTVGWLDPLFGDFNADGKVDAAARASNGQWWVGTISERGDGSLLLNTWSWTGWSPIVWSNVVTGDYNGDGRADILGRTSWGQWWLAESSGTRFTNRSIGFWDESAGWANVLMADLNGDGRDELLGRTSFGHWFRTYFDGTNDVTPVANIGYWLAAEDYQAIQIADIDQDGKDDLIGRRGTNGIWRIDKLVDTALQTHTAASKQPDWDEAIAWLFATVGKNDGNLF